MKSIPNWISYDPKFSWIFIPFFGYFLALRIDFGVILKSGKFLCGPTCHTPYSRCHAGSTCRRCSSTGYHAMYLSSTRCQLARPPYLVGPLSESMPHTAPPCPGSLPAESSAMPPPAAALRPQSPCPTTNLAIWHHSHRCPPPHPRRWARCRHLYGSHLQYNRPPGLASSSEFGSRTKPLPPRHHFWVKSARPEFTSAVASELHYDASPINSSMSSHRRHPSLSAPDQNAAQVPHPDPSSFPAPL
jgi:hypothetical protein